MKLRNAVVLSLVSMLCLSVAHSKSKKSDVSAVFQNAQYVYVESVDGDALRPGLYPEDRQAIANVEDSLRDWNRYVLVLRRDQADIVFVVRKGREAGAQARAGISGGPRTQPGQYPNQPGQYPNQQGQDPTQVGPGAGQGPNNPNNGPMVGVRGDVGPSDDLLRVFARTGEGKLTGPIWTRELEGGLDAPSVELVRQLKLAVEKAYPQTPPKQTPQPPKP